MGIIQKALKKYKVYKHSLKERYYIVDSNKLLQITFDQNGISYDVACKVNNIVIFRSPRKTDTIEKMLNAKFVGTKQLDDVKEVLDLPNIKAKNIKKITKTTKNP